MAPKTRPQTPAPRGRRIQTRRSAVHGNGVFAVQDIPAGATLIEYAGELISWKEALRRHPHDPKQPNHTFYFHIDDKHVIDAKVGGNASRWINHSCDPNCEADEAGTRVFIKSLRPIRAGEELSYDYGLVIDQPYTPELLADFACWCGAKRCRGTMLSPKDDDDADRRKTKKAKVGAKKKGGADTQVAGREKRDLQARAKPHKGQKGPRG